jgi:hypothetical protein
MSNSTQADEVLHRIRELRAARQQRLERDLHYIDAQFDRRIRRINSRCRVTRTDSSPLLPTPICVRRCYRRGVRRLRRRLATRVD